MEYETITNYTKTPAKLISLIVRKVYEKSGHDFEQHQNYSSLDSSFKASEVKAVCVYICDEIVKDGNDSMCKILHIKNKTLEKYISGLNKIISVDHRMKLFISGVKADIVIESVTHEKYYNFIKQEVIKRLKLINQ